MANTTVGASVQVEFASVGQMRKAIKEATSDLIAMQEQFGKTSPQAIAAAKRIAELKDRIEDAREQADLFDPGKRFSAFANAANQIAAGFSAVQGAMALVGTESQDLQKALVKVQGAIALSQGLSQLKDLGKAYDEIKTTIAGFTIVQKANAAATNLTSSAMKAMGIAVNTTSVSFKVLRTAIISTGIGALVVAIGFAVQKMMEWYESTNNQKDAEEKLKKAEDDLKKSIDDTNKSIKERNDITDYSGRLAIATAKAQGKSAKELREIEAENARQKRFNAQDDEAAAQKRLNLLKEEGKASKEQLKIAEEDLDAKIKIRQQAFQQERILTQEQIAVTNEENKASKKKRDDEAKKERIEREKKAAEKKAAEVQFQKDLNAAIENEVNAQFLKDQQRREDVEKEIADFDKMVFEISLERAKENAQAKIAIAEEEAQAKIAFTQDIGNALGALSDIIGRETAAGKALAIAQATINTWLGVTEVLKQKSVLPEPAATISKVVNVATIVASGINAVRNIVRTQVPKGGGGSGSVPSISSGAAPISAQASPAVTAQALNAQAINNLGNQGMRAYVLNSDIQNNEQRNAYLQRNARIG